MEIAGYIIFVVIGAWTGWRIRAALNGGAASPLLGIISALVAAVAGGLLFWFLTVNAGGLTSSIAIAVLVGIFLLYLMGFFKKTRTR